MASNGSFLGPMSRSGKHVLPLPAGQAATNSGPTLAAGDSMRITVHGRGAHGSMPQSAVDPVVLASLIVAALTWL
ncbi:peptidase dimerization domain-containing protein [Saccharomonospora cyanea]|uniref:peptidase dimerization domain-containing protein n=1 Tax=Saccharomonospora cyanea TaxID=40989 RepID=UPI00031C0D35